MIKKASLVLFCMVLSLSALAIGIAATSQYQEKENAIRKSCELGYGRPGSSPSQLGSQYFTPEIHLATPSSSSPSASGAVSCLRPGANGEILIRGKMPEGTKFVVENDDINITSQTQVAGITHLVVSVSPNAMPGRYNVTAFAPVTCSSTTIPAAIIAAQMEWHLVASNGWRIDLTNTATGCSYEAYNKSRQYKASFTRGSEAKPFRELSAEYDYNVYDKEAHFKISPYSPIDTGGVKSMTQEEMVAITQKMADPHISQAERQKLIKQIQDYQSSMKQSFAKINEESRPFSCSDLTLKTAGGKVTGTMDCSNDPGKLTVTGTYKYVSY